MTLGGELAMHASRPATKSLGRQFVRTAKHQLAIVLHGRRDDDAADVRPRARRVAAAVALDAPSGAQRQTNVGLLLPASVGGALANVAASLAGQSAGQPELHGWPRGDRHGRRSTLRHQHRF